MIIVSDKVVDIWGKIIGINLTTGFHLPPVTFLRKDATDEGVNHEHIHLIQGVELLTIGFYVVYVANYLYNRIRGMNHIDSYKNVLFEVEAYENENNLKYLFKRKIWAWLKK
tara:strand:+ start:3405 stop:3740 length:336 start_codon:yes stop_codon:yes gene_type:complete